MRQIDSFGDLQMVTLLLLQQEGIEIFQPSLLFILSVLGPSIKHMCNSDPVNSSVSPTKSHTILK